MIAAGLDEWLTWFGWAVVAVSAAILLTQLLRWSRLRIVGILQSTNVPGTALLAFVAVAALVTGRLWLGVAAAGVGAVAATTVVRAVRPTVGPGVVDGTAPTVRIVASNLLYRNDEMLDAADALAATDPDVVFICEYDAAAAEALASHPLRLDRPYRLDDAREKGAGSALWSRLPIVEASPARRDRDNVTVTVDSAVGRLTVLAVHPNTPVHDVRLWRDGLDLIAREAAGIGDPLVVVGDFNATYWHPRYADLRRNGLVDEHVETGQGWSNSWPTQGLIPPWVRLDHVLTGNGARAAALQDLDVPGSDHAGIVIDVALVQRD